MVEPIPPDRAIFLLEPSRTLRGLVGDLCGARGAAAQPLETVADALAATIRRKPVAILSALELPGLGGDSLVAALKCSRHHRAIPIALLSSAPAHTRRLVRYLPDRLIEKGAALAPAIDEFLQSIGLEAPRPQAPKTTLQGRILLAEDSRANQVIFSHVLHVAGADVVIANDGAEAVEAGLHEPFDLVLMDIEMPNVDGRAATAALRQGGRTMPILALTAHDPVAFRPEALRGGFTDVLPKALPKAELIARCRAHLAR